MSLKVLRFLLLVAAVTIVAIVIWIDLSTDLWQEYVVIAGLAAGLVTFMLTAMVIDRIIARSAHERWVPVTRLALGDLRRRLVADLPAYEQPAVRRLPEPSEDIRSLDVLIDAAADERDALTAVLARWSSFLASSADVADIMDAVADAADSLDVIDATAMAARGAVESGSSPVVPRELLTEIDEYHRSGDMLLAHIDATLLKYGGPSGR